MSESASTLDELKAEIRKTLEDDLSRRTAVQLENTLLDKIADNSKIELPQSMVKHQAQHMAEDYLRNLMYQGITPDRYFEITNTTMEELAENFEEESARRLRHDLILEAVAKAEGITVTDDEVNEEIERRAASMKGTKSKPAHISKARKDNIRIMLERERTIKAIVDNTKVTEVEPAPAPNADSTPILTPKMPIKFENKFGEEMKGYK